MTIRRITRAALAITLAGASLVIAACSSGDDATTPATKSADAAATSASGDQGKASSGTVVNTPPATATTAPRVKVTGTDKEYVKVVCAAFDNYLKDLTAEITKNSNATSDPAAFFKAILASLETVVNALDKANPPGDVRPYHEALMKQNRTIIADIKANKLQTIEDFTSRLNAEQPSASIQARLAAAAKDDPACADNLIFAAQ